MHTTRRIEREKNLERIYPRLTDRLPQSIWNQYFDFEDTKNSKKDWVPSLKKLQIHTSALSLVMQSARRSSEEYQV